MNNAFYLVLLGFLFIYLIIYDICETIKEIFITKYTSNTLIAELFNELDNYTDVDFEEIKEDAENE